jgi:glycosyltransferase involved in cell wall biosynthesis
MLIGMITGEYPPMVGGVGDVVRHLALALVAQGHEVVVLTDVRGQGIAGDPIQVDACVPSWETSILEIAQQWRADRRLDAVNFHYQASAFQMSMAVHLLPLALVREVAVITTFHDLLGPRLVPGAESLPGWLIVQAAKASSGLIFINQRDAQKLRAEVNRPFIHIPIASNIPDNPDPSILPRSIFGLTDEQPLLGYFGLVDPRKGLETLIGSLGNLVAGGVDARLAMIGARANTVDLAMARYSQSIVNLIEERNLADRAFWTDFLPDRAVSSWLRALDMLILPFRQGLAESNGTLFAGLVHGCPIITTRPAVPISTFRDGENVYLVDSGDEPALTAAIALLLRDSQLRAHLSRQARAAGQQFTWDNHARTTAAFFRQTMLSKPDPTELKIEREV